MAKKEQKMSNATKSKILAAVRADLEAMQQGKTSKKRKPKLLHVKSVVDHSKHYKL